MRNLEVFAVAVLCGLTLSCAPRVVAPAHAPAPPRNVASKARLHHMEAGRQAVKIVSRARQRLAIRAYRIAAWAQPERYPESRVPLPVSPPLPPASPFRRRPPQAPLAQPVAAQARSRPPVEALMPPPPEPATPTFPSAAPAEPVTAARAEAAPEPVLPPPPEPAEPSFPATASIPPPPEPAEPSLPTQEEAAAESAVPVPFPEPPAYLSLRARPDWADIVGSIGPPRRTAPSAAGGSEERAIPRLIRTPWPLAGE